jgi:hypothetical protein
MGQVGNRRMRDVVAEPRANAPSYQLTSFQEPVETLERFSPDTHVRRRQPSAHNGRPQMGTRSPNGYGLPDTGEGVFYSQESAQTIPSSASELVIELGANLTTMRQEVAELRQTVERLAEDNKLLRETRDDLSLRITRLETELADTQERESMVRTKFDELGQRMQQYNSRRQNQIIELNSIIDQLETQLKSTPIQPSVENPYRNTSNSTEKQQLTDE